MMNASVQGRGDGTPGTERARPGWAVTDIKGEVVLHSSPRVSGRLLDFWKGTNRLWRVTTRGGLRELSDDEYRHASEVAHAR